ncbi:hypothetical protein H4S08_003298 [Coemansia sp. RSA 1365]|nr:hypothetical protein H4S08_003298 [Coemansia sp. RSA 1365]
MITGSDDYLIKIWCTQTGYLINTFKGHQDVVTDIALNIENTLLASASADGTVRIWNIKSGEPRAVLVANPHGRAKSITAVNFSPSARSEIRFLATTCDDGLCRLYRWDRNALAFDSTPIIIDGRPQPRGGVSSFAFNHTGSRFAIATTSGYVSIYSTIAEAPDTPDEPWGPPQLIARVAAHDESITTLVFSNNGEMFLTGSTDGTVKVWSCHSTSLRWDSITIDIKEPTPDFADAPESTLASQTLPSQPVAPVAAAVIGSVNNRQVPAAPSNHSLNVTPHQSTQLLDMNGGDLHPLDDVTMTATDVETLATAEVTAAQGPDAVGAMATALQDTSQPVSGQGDVELVADINEPQTSTSVAPKRVETNQVAWMCDNSRIMISNNIGTVAVFDPHTGRECWRHRAHSLVEVYVLIPHPTDPRIAVSGGYDGRALIWDVLTGTILREFRVGEQLFDGSFSEDGTKFALTSESGAATLFGLGPSWAYADAELMHEQMFDSDYTATIMDENRFVADQQTQIPAYLVPHGALMDFDGRVYSKQKGPRFGMDIEMGVDPVRFAREDAARLTALEEELEHAYLDRRAAQNPIAETRSSHARRRRARNPRAEPSDEIPEIEMPPLIIPLDDDSDDEEYNAGQDEEEDEDEPLVAEDEDDETPAPPHITRSTEDQVISALDDDRDRRSALEILRSRHRSTATHNLRSASWRSPRRSINVNIDTDDDVDIDSMDVDSAQSPVGSYSGRAPVNGTARRSLRSRRQLRSEGGARMETEAVSSGDDFQPQSSTGENRVRLAPRRSRVRGRRHAAISNDVSHEQNGSDMHRQTRRRRIASDDESEDESVTSGMAQVDIGANDETHADVDIDGISASDADMAELLTDSRHQTRRSGHTDGTGGTFRGRVIEFTSESEGNSDDGFAESASAGDHTVSTRGTHRSNGHMQVPRSNGISSSDEHHSPPRGRVLRRQGKGISSTAAPTATAEEPLASTSAATGAVNGLYMPTDWILATKPSTVPYRPQIGDIIVYFKEGHSDFWNSPSRCMKLSEKLLPYVAVPSLPVAVYGKVVGLQYSVGPPAFCTVKIQMLQHQTVDELDLEDPNKHELTRRFIQVQYHDCDGVPDFMVLYSRYRASLRQSLQTGDTVSVLFDEDQAHKAIIAGFRDIKATSRQTSVTRLISRNPWKSIVVEWTGEEGNDPDARTEQVSPWELVHDEDATNVEIPEEYNRQLLEIVEELRNDPEFVWFVQNVDYVGEYPNYLLSIAYPMCLDTIYERLKNNFYRQISAVSFDMGLIQENADIFNDPGTLVPIAAQKLMTSYHEKMLELMDSENDAESVDQTSPSTSRRTRRTSSSYRNSTISVKAEPLRSSRKRKSRMSGRQNRRSSRRRLQFDDGSDDSDIGSSTNSVDAQSDVQYNVDASEDEFTDADNLEEVDDDLYG